MQIEHIPIEQLFNNDGQIPGVKQNPRDLTNHGFELAIESITNFPEMLEVRTLVVAPHEGKYMVIGGNQRLRALVNLKYQIAPCIVVDWHADKINEFIIKDNLEYGTWSWDLIANEWDEEELIEWGLSIPENIGEIPIDTDTSEVNDDNPNNDKICQLGDVWVLGNHRLICGDVKGDCDDIIKIWQNYTKKDAILDHINKTFNELANGTTGR